MKRGILFSALVLGLLFLPVGPSSAVTPFVDEVVGVPEPAILFLLGSGLFALAGLRRKFRK